MRRIMLKTFSSVFAVAVSSRSHVATLADQLVVDSVDDGTGRTPRQCGLVPLHHPAGELALRLADRASHLVVELDGKVGDPPRGDVLGHVDLAATHDPEVDHRVAGGRVEPEVGGREPGVLETVHQLAEGLLVIDPTEELPDRPEVLDVVDQGGAGQGHQQWPGGAGPDALGQLERVP
jgi:hypothetical protein